MTDHKVFFVDDDEVTLFLYKRIARKLGVEGVFCENGQQLLDQLKEVSSGLIVLDINMPVLNGIQVVEFLKENNLMHDYTVLAMLGSASMDKKTVLKDLGVTHFSEKPLKASYLQELLEPNAT
ncbi:response regulator [Luteibaculum oceani]|uniref:Response regulator n=1 Tax=Luteibaculum oceani TaxID=1294296 RepID=A0A5C6UUJ2_9FLAO|nr:response regulator [Luteibaculum oceani]TXC77042.1 response regulator [Luteibaculum oceani]